MFLFGSGLDSLGSGNPSVLFASPIRGLSVLITVVLNPWSDHPSIASAFKFGPIPLLFLHILFSGLSVAYTFSS